MPSFLFVDTGSFFPPNPNVISPVTGSTVYAQRGSTAINGTGTLAALTMRMPANPYVGGVVKILPNVAVTALTLQTAGGTAIAGAPTAGVAGKPISLLWTGTVWQPEVD